MADALLSFGLENLLKLIVQESARFKGVDKEFSKLKSRVEKLRGFLEDADAKKHTLKFAITTVNEIREIIYEGEDIIETFVQKKKLWTTSGIMERITQLARTIPDRRKVSFDMEDLSERIATVNDDMKNLGLQAIGNERNMLSLQKKQREMRNTYPDETEEHLVGLEKNIEKLVGHLVDESSCQVVSITGMGGIGKTTLAKEVFNHKKVRSHFQGFAWVCVSHQFSRESVWRSILGQLRPEYLVPDMADDELQRKLRRVLGEEKALIVLDDIWREDDSTLLMKPMLPPKKDWKVLITSRIEGVTKRAYPTCSTFEPEFLTSEESWTLFQKIVIPSENTTEHKFDEEMENLGKQMVKDCNGLPLAVNVLGGLLREQYTLREWKRVRDNIKSRIIGRSSFNERNISSVFHVLNLSFEELPTNLKHCFLYLAQFPDDYAIDVEELSYYWASEGIPGIMSDDRDSIRDVTDGYIEELVKRNMVISKKDVSTSRFETCYLHDTMREVCMRKVGEKSYVQIIDTNTITSAATSSSPCKSRRLAIHSSYPTVSVEGYILQNPKLRSFLFIKQPSLLKWMASGLCFTKLQLLRVLDLSRAEFEGGKLPSSIGKLIHLRYLSLLGAYVTHLPSSMRNLQLLIYLNLCVAEEGSPVYMSNFLKELQELRYLSLPLEIQDKTKLELGNLTNLEKLENFPTKCSNVSDLQGMVRLRNLSILLNGEGCSMETLSSSLGEMQHLENLTISGHRADRKIDILDVGRREVKPIHVKEHFLSHLTTLSLRHCYLEEDPMPVLEKLPQLKKVTLGENSFCGFRIVCSAGGFPQLQMLTLYGLVEWEEWVVEEGCMSLLHTLSIQKCQKLKELPDGLRFITSLKELTLATSDREFMDKISRGGNDFYKVQHIPLLRIPVFDMYSSDEECIIIDHKVYGH